MTLDNDDTPWPLSVAIEKAFPGGGVTVSGLRREAKRGNLTIERIANRDFVTLREIRRMRERCEIPAKAIETGAGRKVSPAADGRPAVQLQPPGSGPDISPRDAFLARIAARKRKR